MATVKTSTKPATAGRVQPPARVLRRFRLVFNAIKAHFRSVEKKAGISGAQVWALSVVRDQPGIGVGDLARAMDVHQSTASNLLRALTDAGLVVSGRGAADRRAVQLEITPQGQRILKKAPGPFTGLLPDALQRLDTATLNRLDRDLGRLIDELGIDERGASFPLGSNE
ncbi:MarR family winged helix-turn-helix transcriptional regulator [Ramlibacter sp. PS3R-8]|uniref:MarR family winged helix-turn-helix transcriptional regulator n=1 Tax=Ramlibacter sp. PS3R-8 TaxID=3133437 RepID=UPI0030A40FA2